MKGFEEKMTFGEVVKYLQIREPALYKRARGGKIFAVKIAIREGK